MAAAVPKITLSSSRDIPFNELVLSQSHVRRVKAGVSIEELAEDIARRTLLQSLNARPVLDAEGVETGMFEVPAGGRRYRALQLLVKQKRLAKTALVPCVGRDPSVDISAEEDSLAENVRLHPLNQFRAFQALRQKGQSEEEIAAAFFVGVNVVKQRLRLAAVSEKLLDIYAEDGMSLEQLMAFTVTNDHTTGLKLTDANGIKDELPPITTFLNRLLALTIDLQNVLFTAFEQLLTARIEGAIASGTYDVGLETLRAESFVVADRRTIYTHPGTRAEARLLIITERRRNRPVTLDEALDRLSDPRALLLINERSSRAAVQVPAPSLMLDNAEIERRVRLIRPMESHGLAPKAMAESHWTEPDRERFAAAWATELGEVPEFSDSTVHVVAGLLLPIWKWLPTESTRVYRLQTDAGERIIGRKVSPAWVATALAADAPTLTPETAFVALLEGRTVLDLAEGLQPRRVRVMGAGRIELAGFNDTMRGRLKTYGLFHEIISWKLRIFVPTDATGAVVLARVLDRYPVERIGEREAA